MIYIAFLFFTLIILYVAFYQWQYFLIFSPAYVKGRDFSTDFEIVSIEVEDGVELEGVIYEPKDAKNTLLFFGGRSHDSVALIKKLAENFPTVRIITFNYRSYGRSSGEISENNIMQDGLKIASKIEKNYGAFYILGFSLGSSVASYVASKHSPKALFLIGIYDSIAGIAKTKFGIEISLFLRYKFDNTKIVTKIDAPTYVFVSKDDETTYIQNSRNLKKFYKNLFYYEELDGLKHKELLWNDKIVGKIMSVINV